MIKSISKFMLGTWYLRASNDKLLNYKESISYIEIKEESLKFKHIYNQGIFVEKKSITGTFEIIEHNIHENTAIVDITYNKYNIYSHSLFGIQLPELRSKNKILSSKRKVTAKLLEGSLLIEDTKTPLYYLFDLQKGKIKSPYIEISFNTFIFSQTMSVFLTLLFNHL
jgi:hypothetical protein